LRLGVIDMGLARQVGKNIGKAMASIRAGDDKLASRKLGDGTARTLEVTSSAFTDGGMLPRAYTADGAGAAPPIAWSNVPRGTHSIVVVVEDSDAPLAKPFVHWLVYDLPPRETSLDGPPAHGHEGKNSLLEIGYTPASPPIGHGLHHYHFQVFALDTVLQFATGMGRQALVDAIHDRVLAWGEIVATYERS
jgi:hypothetical protein